MLPRDGQSIARDLDAVVAAVSACFCAGSEPNWELELVERDTGGPDSEELLDCEEEIVGIDDTEKSKELVGVECVDDEPERKKAMIEEYRLKK